MFVWVELEGESAVGFTNVSGRGGGGEREGGVEDSGECGLSGVGEEGGNGIGVVHCAMSLYSNGRWGGETKDSRESRGLNIA